MIWRFSGWHLREYAWRVFPGLLVASGVGLLVQMGGMLPLESLAYNTLFQIRGARKWDDRIVLIKIDDPSLRRLGRFPWPRRHYQQLLDSLQSAEPSVVTFDLIFSEPSPDDERFAEAMENQGHVVLGQAVDQQGLPLPPVSRLQEAAIATGHVLVSTDWDGVTRKVPLQSRDMLNLGAVSTQAYSLVQSPVTLPDLAQPFWINWPGPGSELQQYSFIHVLDGTVDPQVFHNKLVFVGVTATGFDTLVTPFDRNPPVTGVYLHAAIASNLLQQNVLQADQKPKWIIWLFLATPLFGLFLSAWRTEAQLAIGTFTYLGWLGLAYFLFLKNIWILIALPTSLIIITTICVVLWERIRMNFYLQNQVSQLWKRYLPDLLTQGPNFQQNLHQQRFRIPCAHPTSLQTVAQLTYLAEMLGRSQSTQSAIAEHLSLGLVATDAEGKIWFCNPIAIHHLNLKQNDWLEKVLVPNWFQAEYWQAALQVLKQDETVFLGTLERASYCLSLRLEPLHYPPPSYALSLDTLEPCLSENTMQFGMLLVVEDVTLQQQVQANLVRQVVELDKLAALKDDFLSTVSHELRTPIVNMRLAIEMLQMNLDEAKHRQYLKILEQECVREQELINDLLDLQCLEAAQESTELVSLEIQHWLPDLLEPFQARTTSQQQRLFIEVNSHVPVIVTEEKSLRRILMELVNNACKYTPPLGQIEVYVTLSSFHQIASGADDIPSIDFIVSNLGSEIPAEELTKIFNKFYRVPAGDPWEQGGTGLGLALVERLIERLEGSIKVTSENMKTVFTVKLPLQRAAS
ncbi:MAG: CHASE2 domain-containing protein [Synechococcales bacterium]|nr:CHASE2 domain-containing protein [Synechococcales bacterium]